MSQQATFKCDGCPKTAEAGSFYALPTGWRSHLSQEGGGLLHACGADCMVKVLRADAGKLETEEAKRRAAAQAHAEDAERARLDGLRRAEAAARTKDGLR